MQIAIGSDHAGLRLKRAMKAHMEALGHEVHDVGTFTEDSTDYPDHARHVAERVISGEADRGVLVCGTGHGMAISANKHRGVRAVCPLDTFSARKTAAHNDANVLCLGERTTGEGLAADILDAWLSTSFEGGRHARRVDMIEP
ncbi:MAG: ribose 5-phosphate isomerase B [Deltaproteobacteria bacterium]|nr:ribose 5-phosphate isomerase B [Deltaproteobacteria bacterium]MBW2255589.1 ribose 5-phosphate isomerase B [Deltaproteobacteria bacterium]